MFSPAYGSHIGHIEATARADLFVIALATDSDRDVLPHFREIRNVWTMAKDGKQHFDRCRYPKEMHK